MKAVVVGRAGNLSVADHLNEMRAWLKQHGIEPRELTMMHVLEFRVVFRAVFDNDADADVFVRAFG